MPHLEFTVDGPPVSSQTGGRARLAAWKAVVAGEAARYWAGKPPLTGRLKCTIIYFHEGETALIDDDNMVKPIRDAMNQLVYDDDRRIIHSETIQVSIEAPVKSRRASPVVLMAYHRGDPFVYVRIDDAPEFVQLPQ